MLDAHILHIKLLFPFFFGQKGHGIYFFAQRTKIMFRFLLHENAIVLTPQMDSYECKQNLCNTKFIIDGI